ncbi:MAG: type IV pilus modification PilV family protein [Thermodesulfobacteriota bacterium]
MDRNGFTFVEVMIAMTVFSIGMLGIIGLQLSGIGNNRLGGLGTRAMGLAQMQMEQIMQMDFQDPGIRDVNPGNNGDLMSVKNVDYRNIDAFGNVIDWHPFTLVWNVAADVPIPETKTIVITIQWDNGKRSRQLVGIKSSLW